MSPAAQRAIEWLDQQITDLNEIRNATARDPSFKNWRQATLTALQRIWPSDQTRIERFRRIPFSPVDPRADVRAVREGYSRGCQEAGRVLKSLIEEIERDGVPEGGERLPEVAASEFEDGFPTVDLPLGDAVSTRDPASLVEDLMGDMGDLPPQGHDPSSPAPPRLPSELASPPPLAPPAPPAPPAPTMAERIALEAAAAAAAAPALPVTPIGDVGTPNSAPRKGLNMKARLKDLLGFAQLSAKALAGFPREDEGEANVTPSAPAPPIAAAPPAPPVVVPPTPIAVPLPLPAAVVAVTPPSPPAPVVREPLSSGATHAEVSAMLDAWPPKAPASEPAAPIEPASPPVVGGSDAGYESPSVIMSRPTTLRGNIEKVSMDSLISPVFREGEGEDAPATLPTTTPAASEPVTPAPPVTQRPELTLVPPPVLDDPEFMIDPTPSAELPKPSSHMPVPALSPQATRQAPPSPTPPSAPHIVPLPVPVASAPAPPQPIEPDDDEFDAPPSKPDPEAFARAAEDFMKSSPVLGASPRRVTRAPHDEHGFGDPDALAVASIVHELGDMGVPEARYAETRARLLDLARRLERGELDWATLRKAVWFAMEYPDLARRLMPVLLPWMDRAA